MLVSKYKKLITFRPVIVLLLPALSLLLLCIIIYGVFVPFLGFYFDDWPVVWVYKSLGIEGISLYFKGNRPISGYLFSIIFFYLGANPLSWQILALIIKWLSSVAIFFLFKSIFPRNSGEAFLISVLVLIYPGFSQQPLSVTYIPHHVSLLLLLLSMILTVRYIQVQKNRYLVASIAVLLSVLGYLIIEYFAGLEFIRPVIIWLALNNISKLKVLSKIWKITKIWLPCMVGFIVFVWWRVFFVHTWPPSHDGMSQLSIIINNPFAVIWHKLIDGFYNIIMAAPVAWSRTLSPEMINFNFGMSVPFSWGIGVIAAFITFITMQVLNNNTEVYESKNLQPSDMPTKVIILFGLLSLLFAGLPVIYAGFTITFDANRFDDRFTLPYLLGSCVLLFGLLKSLNLNNYGKYIIFSLIIFLFTSFQVRNGNSYRVDWKNQKSLFWQLSWRLPELKKGSSVFVSGLPATLQSNHSAGLLNLLYNKLDSPGHLDYFIFDTDKGLSTDMQSFFPGDNYISSLHPDESTMGGVRSFIFHGNTSNAVVVWNSPSGTLRILDPQNFGENLEFPFICRSLSHISEPSKVVSSNDDMPTGPLLKIFGSEPSHGWTYYYQKASLGCQLGSWEKVAQLGEEAEHLGFEPVDLSEWFPFIKGYAMSGRNKQALSLTNQILKKSPEYLVGLSYLWKGIVNYNSVESGEFGIYEPLKSILMFDNFINK